MRAAWAAARRPGTRVPGAPMMAPVEAADSTEPPLAADIADPPAVFSPVQVAQVKAVACTLPKDYGLPLGDVGEADEFGPADQIEGGGQHGLKPDGFSFQARQVAQPGGLGLVDSVFDAGVFGGDAVPTGPPARGSTPVGVSVRMAVIRCPSPSEE